MIPFSAKVKSAFAALLGCYGRYQGKVFASGILSNLQMTGATQGVLLLNTVLTVHRGRANSHRGKGWEQFTDRVMGVLNERQKPVVFVLWGRNAQMKKAMIDASRHFIIESPHPSPYSANQGFFGSRPFSRVNEYLQQVGMEPIDWEIPSIPQARQA